MKTTRKKSIIFCYILIIQSLCGTEDDFVYDLKSLFPADDGLKSEIEVWMGNISDGNVNEALTYTVGVINKYPNYLLAHLLKGHILFHGLGKIEEAYYEYSFVSKMCSQIKNSDTDYSDFVAEIEDILYQVEQIAIPTIERDYASLRFKIKNKIISKFCHIRNMDVVITYDENVYNIANSTQALRLEFLKDYLASRQMRFQFSAYDSLDNRYYFEIPFFPLIDVPGAWESYAIILNNEKRYHFRMDRQSNETIEIDWNDKWELVESVPENLIKFEFSDRYNIVPYKADTQQRITGTLQIPELETSMKNLYIPVERGQNIEIIIKPKHQDEVLEKGLFYFIRGTIGITILAAFWIVR